MDKNTLISAAGLFAAFASLAGSQLAMLLLRTYATWKVSIAPREKPDKNMTEKQELTLSEILQFYKIYATYIRSGMSPSDQVQDNREMKNLHSKLCEIGRIAIAETAASILLYLQLTALCTNLLSQIVTLVLIWKLTIFEIMP